MATLVTTSLAGWFKQGTSKFYDSDYLHASRTVPNAEGWTIDANFDSGTLGVAADKRYTGLDDGFHGGASKDGGTTGSLYSSFSPANGSQSVRCTILAGTDGFGRWGGVFNCPTDVVEGETIWYRAKIYIPDGTSISTTSPQGLKFLRLHMTNPDGSSRSHLSTLLQGAGVTPSQEATGPAPTVADDFAAESCPYNAVTDSRDCYYLGDDTTTGVWHDYEMACKLSSTDGQGMFRIWHDGTLVFENVVTRTTPYSNTVVNYAYLFSHWNGTVGVDTTIYADSLKLTTTTPTTYDAAGNPCISGAF